MAYSTDYTFTRSSVAYYDNFTQAASGVPRLEYGSVFIEEGTTNTLSANCADGTDTSSNTAGWANLGANTTVASSTEQAHMGSRSLKVVTPGSGATEGAVTTGSGSVTGGATYIASAWVYAPAGALMQIRFYDGSTIFGSVNFVGTGSWQKVNSTAAAIGAGATYVRAYVNTRGSAQAITFYVDTLQVCQKTYITSWMPGGSTRNDEVLTFLSAGNLSAAAGTVEMRVNITNNSKATNANHNLFDVTGTDATHDRIMLAHTTDGKYTLTTWDSLGASSTVSVSDAAYTGLTRFAFKWDSTVLSLSINGSKVGADVEDPKIPGGFGAYVHIGSRYDNTLFADARFSDVHVYTTALSDAALASRGGVSPLALQGSESYYNLFDGTTVAPEPESDTAVVNMLTMDFVGTLILFVVILFAIFVGCEFLRNDMKYIIQGVVLLVNGALCLILGWNYYTGISDGANIIVYEPIGGVFAFFGGMCLLLLVVVWLPKILIPFDGGSMNPSRPNTKRPRGGF